MNDESFLNFNEHSCSYFFVRDIIGEAVDGAPVLHKAVYYRIKLSDLMEEAVKEDTFHHSFKVRLMSLYVMASFGSCPLGWWEMGRLAGHRGWREVTGLELERTPTR